MKRILLFATALLFTATLYSQIGFQDHHVTSFTLLSNNSKTGDIDNDGDLDIVAFGSNSIDWYPNRHPENGFNARKSVNYNESNFIQSIDLSDFDGDGDLDILAADMSSDKIYWHQNLDGQGNFGPAQVLKILDLVQFVRHADMDNDGDKDLIFMRGNESTAFYIGYYENTNEPANYTIYHPITNEFINVSFQMVFNDLDLDGDSDLFLRFNGVLMTIKNYGNGTFSALTPISSINTHHRLFDVGDIDNDGDADLVGYVETNTSNKKLVCYLNDGLGNFGAELIIRQNITLISTLKLDDLDNDGYKDILLSIRNTNPEYYSDLVWQKNSGSLTFAIQPTIAASVRNIYATNTFDIDSDGDKDILTDSNGHRVTTYRNNGLGVFNAPEYPAAATTESRCAVAADIDNDGDIDVVGSSYNEGRVFLYKRRPDGTFANQLIITSSVIGAKEVAVADMDGDADLDIISVSDDSGNGPDKVSWYRNLDGQGNFGPQINLPIGTYNSPDGLRVYDVDGDGDKDIVTAFSNWPGEGDKIIWFANNGLGGFASAQEIGTGINNLQALQEADLDNDGDMDVVSASYSDNKIAWFENLNGMGSFGPIRTVTTAATQVRDVAIADLDTDGNLDIIYMNNSLRKVFWQKNTDGLGNFGPQLTLNSNVDFSGAFTVAARDIDNDSDIDVVVGEGDETNWLENLYGQGNFDLPKRIAINTVGPSSTQLVDYDNDGDLDVLSAGGAYGTTVWHENTGVSRNIIRGDVRLDIAGNGCDATDTPLPNILVSSTNGTTTEATLTLRNEFAGKYYLYAGLGNYQTMIAATMPPHFTLTPATHNATFTSYGNTAIADFCIEPVGQVNELSVALYPLGEARPGFPASYQLVYANGGTTTLTGQTTLQYDNTKMQFVSAGTVPSSQTDNTLNFDFTNLAPFEIRSVRVNFQVFAIPTTNLNENLAFAATITPNTSDYSPEDNVFELNQVVRGSYDPNDITCLEGTQVLIGDADEYLHYIIRFQNTGTASAINVKVQHELDPKLDWTTFKLESLSHDARITIKNESLVEFNFANIQLADSTSDEPNSHGFATFKIKPTVSQVTVGAVVNATANIYFDNNPPITTNTAATEYVSLLGTESFAEDKFSIYPNPAREQLIITSEEDILEVAIHNLLGGKVLEEKNNNTITVSTLETGVYFISVKTKMGNFSKKFIKL
ncbi:T9SS type A sorting domain-containing protein [Flavobacterium enshiense]|uniref:T9SS type A sorting domain-containing protein n=1 Tax=Flavobacterium enshiense TaxID=1341165 RepID=UPI00345D646C